MGIKRADSRVVCQNPDCKNIFDGVRTERAIIICDGQGYCDRACQEHAHQLRLKNDTPPNFAAEQTV